MATNHRRTTADQRASGSTSRESSQPLPSSSAAALKHPLGLSASVPNDLNGEAYARRRRRHPQQSSSALLGDPHERTNGTSYDSKGKSKQEQLKVTTLDKLEGWLGLSTGGDASTSMQNPGAYVSQSPPRSNSSRMPASSRTTRLVVVHPVESTDTLESIALRYRSDVRSIRRANGFWPGDSVTTRKELYIPIEEESEFCQKATAQASEGLGGKLMLLERQNSNQDHSFYSQSRPLSTASASVVSASSQSQSGQTNITSPDIRRLPSESLSHFPPPGTQALLKAKAKEGDAYGYGEGLRPGRDISHGESGVDDLLQLAEKARSRGGSPHREEAPTPKFRPPQTEQTQLEETEGLSPSSSLLALEEPWKPNKWTFGQKRSPSKTALGLHHTPVTNGSSSTEDLARRPAMMPSTSYQGWNDIPEPPLHRIGKGPVAHAYKGSSKRKYPRPGNVDLVGPGALIEDLAAGLPPNAGPASNWARPIAESVPIPESRSLRRSRSNMLMGANQSWAQILSDTVRGKIGLDEALEKGLEDIRNLTMSSSSVQQSLSGATARRAMLLQNSTGTSPNSTPGRPSAELARATLSDGHSESSPSTALPHSNSIDERRSSGRSMHELEVLARRDDAVMGTANAGQAGFTVQDSSIRGRKSVRNVDWLG